jgi:hypothetical protein
MISVAITGRNNGKQLDPDSYGAFSGARPNQLSTYVSPTPAAFAIGFQTVHHVGPQPGTALRTHRRSLRYAQRGKTVVELPSAYSDGWAPLDEPRTIAMRSASKHDRHSRSGRSTCWSVLHHQVGRPRRVVRQMTQGLRREDVRKAHCGYRCDYIILRNALPMAILSQEPLTELNVT